MTLEVGSQAPVPVVAGLVADLNVVAQGALEVATHVAETGADDQAPFGGGVLTSLHDRGVQRDQPVHLRLTLGRGQELVESAIR
ncbi:hypothetical protein [Streptomyces sp. NPDC127190]|uniref:hypothetical protein n=1 Tax=unclassified Streptomyces TaxID=2593676 RepID=UPI003625A158